jgi:anthranilate phosphoribosyltransferase
VITQAIQRLIERRDLSEAEAREVMELIMTGGATDAQLGSFLTALRMKGETQDEVVGFARVMREKATPLWNGDPLDVLDTCGTGGDGSGTFNISTVAAFVAAGAGARVAKHGNRAASSKCGSADVLESLGVNIQMPPSDLRRVLKDVGIGFLFAPSFHTSIKYVMPARKQLGIRTVFNMLGPLANPAGATFQVIGVYSESLLDLMAGAVVRLGVRHAFIVHGRDGVDEITLSAPTDVVEVTEGNLRRFTVEPEDFGVERAGPEALQGGDAATNARITHDILAGETGPRRDIVLINAAAAIAAAGLAGDLAEGFRLAMLSIDSGAARQKLDELKEFAPA